MLNHQAKKTAATRNRRRKQKKRDDFWNPRLYIAGEKPLRRIIGDLSDRDGVLFGLDLKRRTARVQR